MSRYDNGDGHLVFMFFFLLLAVIATQMEQPANSPQVEQPAPEVKTSITCPTCLDIPEGIERTRTTMLFQGPTVKYPTAEYAAFLRGRCENLGNPLGETECKRVNAMLEEGRRYIESWVNPIYGGGPESKSQLASVRHAAYQVMRLVREVEHTWVGTQADKYWREKRKS